MKILSFDTTTKDLVISLYIDGRITGRVAVDCLTGHSEILLPEIDELLDSEGLGVSDIDLFAACIGPGSFTGIRIGASTLRALCQATGKPAVAVNSLEYRAYHVLCQNRRAVALDAMQNKVYYALFDGETQVTEPSFCEKEELKDRLPKHTWVLSDTELDIPYEGFAQLYVRLAEFVYDHRDRAGRYEDAVPLYVRRCQAEEDLGEKA